MVTVKIGIEPYLKEYLEGKFWDSSVGAVRFQGSSDLYVLLWDLLAKRPVESPCDRGNTSIALPDRRLGKDPLTYNFLSSRSVAIFEKRIRVHMWAELHEMMDENKHLRGIMFKDSVAIFMSKYGIESISEDALLKNYQRWRDKLRRTKKRAYAKS